MNTTVQNLLGTNYKTYIVLFLCALIIGIKLGTLIPLLALILEARGYSNTEIGLNVVAQPLAVILFVRITPIIIHKIGLAKSIIIAQIFTIILYFTFPEELSEFSIIFLILSSMFTSFISAAFGIGGGAVFLGLLAIFLNPIALLPVHGFVQIASNFGRMLLMIKDVYKKPIFPFFIAFSAIILIFENTGSSRTSNLGGRP